MLFLPRGFEKKKKEKKTGAWGNEYERAQKYKHTITLLNLESDESQIPGLVQTSVMVKIKAETVTCFLSWLEMY